MVAMATILERLEHPEFPVRDIKVPTSLAVRKSCGAAWLRRPEEPDLARCDFFDSRGQIAPVS